LQAQRAGRALICSQEEVDLGINPWRWLGRTFDCLVSPAPWLIGGLLVAAGR